MKLNVIIHTAEEGGFWAEVPALKGCVSEGETMDEVIFNIKEAIEGWLESQNNMIQTGQDTQIIEVQV